MHSAVLLIVFLAFQEIKGVKLQNNEIIKTFERSSDHDSPLVRTERSASAIACPKFSDSRLELLDESYRSIKCVCSTFSDNSVTWLDNNCKELSNNVQFQINNDTLTITYLSPNGTNRLVYCTDNANCTSEITVSERIAVEGMPRALQGFVMFLVGFTLLGLIAFIFKKYRYEIYLGCRDSCGSSDSDDGQEFDAYISVGKSISDIKFVEKNIVDVLQLKYNYKLFVDDDNLLPRLDYSENVQTKMHLSRRLIIVLTPAYMTNEWCMYCFAEGLRKLLELNVQMIFIVTDVSIQREINALSSLIGKVPKLFLSTLPMMQSKADKDRTLQKLRLLMPPSKHGSASGKGLTAPMLGNAEDMDQRPVRESDSYGGTKYTFGDTPTGHKEEVDMEELDAMQQELEYDDDDPTSIRVNQYKPRLDFLRITREEDYK